MRFPSEREAEILAILVDGKRYGLEIRNLYRKELGRELPLGSLYTTLDRMEEKGLVKSELGAASNDRGGNRKRFFWLTASGQAALDVYQLWRLRAARAVPEGAQNVGGLPIRFCFAWRQRDGTRVAPAVAR